MKLSTTRRAPDLGGRRSSAANLIFLFAAACSPATAHFNVFPDGDLQAVNKKLRNPVQVNPIDYINSNSDVLSDAGECLDLFVAGSSYGEGDLVEKNTVLSDIVGLVNKGCPNNDATYLRRLSNANLILTDASNSAVATIPLGDTCGKPTITRALTQCTNPPTPGNNSPTTTAPSKTPIPSSITPTSATPVSLSLTAVPISHAAPVSSSPAASPVPIVPTLSSIQIPSTLLSNVAGGCVEPLYSQANFPTITADIYLEMSEAQPFSGGPRNGTRNLIIIIFGISVVVLIAECLIFYGHEKFRDQKYSLDTPQTGTRRSTTSSSLGSTGTVFTGRKIREYKGLIPHSSSVINNKSDLGTLFPNVELKIACDQWAVVTTIFKPQVSFEKIIELPSKWCLVIVGDEATPDFEYEKLVEKHDHVFYLSAEYQKKYLESNDFVSVMPFRSFARKNVGYLFAIYSGAKVIFDFDDDNVLTPLSKDTAILPPPFFWMDQTNSDDDKWMEASMLLQFIKMDALGPRLSFNPFKYMGPSIADSWPRGFPLTDLQDDFGTEAKQVLFGDLPYKAIGVIQSLCNGNPDTDAIFRLTRAKATEFNFQRSTSSLPLLVPSGHYAPYNAQATTHLHTSFWGLYLPISVPGRVTDIWRSYIVQRMMKDVGLHLVYTPPIVEHDRSPHNYLADHAAELDLYHKTPKLLEHLDGWSSSKETFTERIMDLWIDLFEHDYLGAEDVEAVGHWLNVLISINYKFPSLTKEDSVDLPRPQPTLEGQPYRSFPYYNVDKNGQKFSETNDLVTVSEWGSKVSSTNRPAKAVVKIIMMTMNEWPLLKYWVPYHGKLYGFQNLYIIDSSDNPNARAFLVYARDILGANVLFSNANLNELEDIMTEIGNNLSGSSDLIIKMDTDEYLTVYDEGSKEMKASIVSQYLLDLRKDVTPPEDLKMCTRFVQQTVASRDICDKDINAPPYSFPLKRGGSVWVFKAVFDSRFIHNYGIGLGGHAHKFGEDCVNKGQFSIMHAHRRCFEIEQENNKRVLVRHNYINETDSKNDTIQKLKKLITCDMVDECTCVREGCPINSCHKVDSYLNFLLCPDKAKDAYYASDEETFTNDDLAYFISSSVTKYGP